jgi:hypothetical protein
LPRARRCNVDDEHPEAICEIIYRWGFQPADDGTVETGCPSRIPDRGLARPAFPDDRSEMCDTMVIGQGNGGEA